MALDKQGRPQTANSPQELQNDSFDPEFRVAVVEMLGVDPDTNTLNRVRVNSAGQMSVKDDNVAKKITVSGDYTYIATAAVGTADASAAWRVFRIDTSVAGDTRFMWADGDDNYDNVATDLTALSYS